jgi:hypothetical protein
LPFHLSANGSGEAHRLGLVLHHLVLRIGDWIARHG